MTPGRPARRGFTVPLDGFRLHDHPRIAVRAEALGYSDAWSLEVDGSDGFTPLAAVATSSTLRTGTAIANVFTRGPATLAMTAAGMADLAEGRFVLGLGASSQPVVEAWNGGRYERPLIRMREMVAFLRQALTGERTVFKGETFSVDGFRLTRPPTAPVPIHVAALRPGMLQLAARVGDGVCLNWLSAEDAARSIGIVRDAALAAGREPGDVEVTARVFVWADPPGPELDVAVRRHIAAYLNVPVYRAFHEWLGRTSLRPMWEAWAAGDRRGALAAIPDEAIDEVVVRGDVDARRRRVTDYEAAGVDTVIMHFLTSETDETKKAAAMMRVLEEMAPDR